VEKNKRILGCMCEEEEYPASKYPQILTETVRETTKSLNSQ
jgi:hypothetical protein